METPEELLKRITRNPAIYHGVPVIRNKRYPVWVMLELLASGMSTEDILADYPGLVADDIQACLLFAARLADIEFWLPGEDETEDEERERTKGITIPVGKDSAGYRSR
jgi:uncharacterized protein (DUF433 family)